MMIAPALQKVILSSIVCVAMLFIVELVDASPNVAIVRRKPPIPPWIPLIKGQRLPTPTPPVTLPPPTYYDERTVGWGGEEQLTYEISLAGIVAARAAIRVETPSSSRGNQIAIRFYGETIPMIASFVKGNETITSVIDRNGIFPVSTHSLRDDGREIRRIDSAHGVPLVQMIHRTAAAKPVVRKRQISLRYFDPLSLLYWLRSIPLPNEGDANRVTILVGSMLYELNYRRGQNVVMRFNGLPKEATVLSGTAYPINDRGTRAANAKPVTLMLWLTTDRKRLPLQMRAETPDGQIEARLTDYRIPQSRFKVRPAKI